MAGLLTEPQTGTVRKPALSPRRDRLELPPNIEKIQRQDMLASHDLPVILTADEQSELAELARPAHSLGAGVVVDGRYLLPLLPFYSAGAIKSLLGHLAEERWARHRLRAPGRTLPARPTTCAATKYPTPRHSMAAGGPVRDYRRGAPALRAGTPCHPHRLAD